MNKKICTQCGKRKKIEELTWQNKAENKKHPRCKACVRKNSRKHYNENKIYYKKRGRRRRQQIRNLIIEAKSVPCTDCNRIYPYYVMDFDHIKQKKNIIASLIREKASFKKIKEEINRCEVTCANCHRIRTFKQRES